MIQQRDIGQGLFAGVGVRIQPFQRGVGCLGVDRVGARQRRRDVVHMARERMEKLEYPVQCRMQALIPVLPFLRRRFDSMQFAAGLAGKFGEQA